MDCIARDKPQVSQVSLKQNSASILQHAAVYLDSCGTQWNYLGIPITLNCQSICHFQGSGSSADLGFTSVQGVFQMMSMEFHCQGRILQHWTSIPHEMAFFWRKKNTIFRPKHQISSQMSQTSNIGSRSAMGNEVRYHSQGAANIGLPGTFVAVAPGEDRNGVLQTYTLCSLKITMENDSLK